MRETRIDSLQIAEEIGDHNVRITNISNALKYTLTTSKAM